MDGWRHDIQHNCSIRRMACSILMMLSFEWWQWLSFWKMLYFSWVINWVFGQQSNYNFNMNDFVFFGDVNHIIDSTFCWDWTLVFYGITSPSDCFTYTWSQITNICTVFMRKSPESWRLMTQGVHDVELASLISIVLLAAINSIFMLVFLASK